MSDDGGAGVLDHRQLEDGGLEDGDLEDGELAGYDALESEAEQRKRLVDLFSEWDYFYQATTPVDQASALLEFANAFYHFRTATERRWAVENSTASST